MGSEGSGGANSKAAAGSLAFTPCAPPDAAPDQMLGGPLVLCGPAGEECAVVASQPGWSIHSPAAQPTHSSGQKSLAATEDLSADASTKRIVASVTCVPPSVTCGPGVRRLLSLGGVDPHTAARCSYSFGPDGRVESEGLLGVTTELATLASECPYHILDHKGERDAVSN